METNQRKTTHDFQFFILPDHSVGVNLNEKVVDGLLDTYTLPLPDPRGAPSPPTKWRLEPNGLIEVYTCES